MSTPTLTDVAAIRDVTYKHEPDGDLSLGGRAAGAGFGPAHPERSETKSVSAMAAMFDDCGGQALYRAALRELHAGTLCPECKHTVEWRFRRYVDDRQEGHPLPVRMAVAECEKCGHERRNNADRLEEASTNAPPARERSVTPSPPGNSTSTRTAEG